jgi:hypothetical protein
LLTPLRRVDGWHSEKNQETASAILTSYENLQNATPRLTAAADRVC